jgi:hypothetical protein
MDSEEIRFQLKINDFDLRFIENKKLFNSVITSYKTVDKLFFSSKNRYLKSKNQQSKKRRS